MSSGYYWLKNWSTQQLLDEAEKEKDYLFDIVEEAFRTLPIDERINKASQRLLKPTIKNLGLFPVIAAALKERGLEKEAESIWLYWRGAKRAADFDDEPIGMYSGLRN